MCFYAVYFISLITGSYFYYEKFSGHVVFDLDNFMELFWIVFNSLSYLCIIGICVTITKEVGFGILVFYRMTFIVISGYTNCHNCAQSY